jgi:ADP-ribosyl-[dinitrogen reductase] hydrolase
MIRTSLTHPIRIDPLPVGNGLLGLTFCPGKRARSLYGPPWDRDLGADLDAIRGWGASLIVTLMERSELDRFRVPDLPERASERGIGWVHLPIIDGDIPRAPFLSAWPAARADLLRRLDAGGRVLIHCRGGLGRTGVLAAMLLMERGAGAGEAIRRVRAARPGSVENERQELFLAAYQPGGAV